MALAGLDSYRRMAVWRSSKAHPKPFIISATDGLRVVSIVSGQ